MSDTRFEVQRKTVHLALTGYPLPLLLTGATPLMIAGLTFAFALVWILSEHFRIKYNVKNTPSGFIIRLVSRRLHENPRHPSWRDFRYPWWLTGVLVAALLFPTVPLLGGIAMLAFGDLSAAIAGKALGRPKIYGEKTLEGSLACLLVGAITVLLITKSPNAAVGASVFGTLGELFSGKRDNLVLAPAAAAGAQAAQYFRLLGG